MFKGLGNIGNIAAMVGSLQKMPEKMKELNDRMQNESVTGKSDCGRVTITASGVGEVRSVDIQPGLEGEELNQAVLQAANAAGAAAKQLYATSISEMVKDMDINLPGIDGMISSLTGNASS